MKVLFLGDDGHHKPLERYRQAASEMTRRGVDMTYVDDMGQVTPENLKRFDVLALYANITKAPPAVERAILDFVEAGGGYAVLHCGSFCFQNSQPLVALTGGQFKRHGTGVFKETHVAPEHPILKGLHEIESWDESYVHEKHNEAGRELLSTRDDNEGKEPYTWTRTQGKGRVFYTAWGHDERTWGNKDFIDLLERGVRWSAGDWAMQPPAALAPFEYGEGRAPNYLGAKQGGGDVITKIQKPLTPTESAKHLIAPAGVEAKLFASEPKIFKPIAMAWDARGRLWVAETFDYPNQLQPQGQGRDRISILEDTDGDGVADKFTVFADKLSIPTSLCFANGGVIVTQAPHMLFLKDTNGDDVADERKILFSGWGTSDTHAGPSNLRYGPDNWIYGIVGYSGFNGEVGGEKLRFSQGVWRMRPDGSKLEFVAGMTNNSWGLGFSEEGHVFSGTANGAPCFYMHIPNRAYESVRGMTVRRLEPIADLTRMFTATQAVRQVDFHGGYTAAAGHALYTARTWPSYYWNRTSFVAEPTGHIVGQFLLQPKGAGFVARNDASLLASDDEWTSPIVAEVGPDGQVWVIDWYNYIVQHNPIPKGWERGKGGAYESDLRDKTHGRVYRLVYKDGKPSATFDLTKADNATLLAALKSDNQFWRMHAQRLLVEKGDKAVGDDLVKLAGDRAVDGIGLNPAAVHALWTLKGLGLLDGPPTSATAAATQALGHPSAGVRKAALDTLPRTEAGMAALRSAKSLDDADPQVRKSALLAIAEMPADVATGETVYAALARQDNVDDRWLADAITIAGARHDAGFLKAALASFKAADPAATAAAAAPPAVNLMPNPSFEDVAATGPKGWKVRHYQGTAEQVYATGVARTGTRSLMIKSTRGADSSWFADVAVEPNTKYRLSAWVKTEGLKKSTGAGAMLNVHGTEFRTDAVVGTADWRQVQVEFNSGPLTKVSINCLYGGYGLATGVAYWDDIELVKAGGSSTTALTGPEGRVVGAVITHYALRAPKESVVQTLAALKTAQPAMATLVVDALAGSWPDGKATAPELSAADATELNAVLAALPPRARDRLLALAGKWGRPELFGDALAGMAKELTATLADVKQPAAKRGDAAKRLLALADSAENTAAVVKLVTATAGPDVQTELLAAVADSKVPAVGEQLVGQWMKMSPTAQRLGLSTLLRRDPWTKALLAGVKANTINPKDLQPQQWDALTRHADAAIAAEAKDVQKNSGQAVSADRKAIVDKLLPLAVKKGDAEKGKLVFAKNCLVCHQMDAAGGKVGPDLTGVGARPKADILMEVLDPNRSVEGTYRQWAARTTDDEVITGRLLSESQTSVEIIDATAKVFAIQRDKLKTLVASDRSVMPEGFEALPPEDLTDLLEYLETSKVKQ